MNAFDKFNLMFFLFFVFLIIACRSQNNFKNGGVIEHRVRIYDSTRQGYLNEFIAPDMKIWYKDNLVIEEIKTVKITDTSEGITKEVNVAYYLFIDTKSKVFYNYSSFSDTAKILNKYSQADTMEIPGLGGWRFYASHDLNAIESPRFLADTTINYIVYKRVQLIVKGKNTLTTVIGYLRCDKKGTMFQIDKNFSKKMGCPMVRVDYLASPQDPLSVSTEIVFINDSLSKAELKVFEAWEKNMKKYPVSK